jgi:hypothetical protein
MLRPLGLIKRGARGTKNCNRYDQSSSRNTHSSLFRELGYAGCRLSTTTISIVPRQPRRSKGLRQNVLWRARFARCVYHSDLQLAQHTRIRLRTTKVVMGCRLWRSSIPARAEVSPRRAICPMEVTR